MIAWDTPFQSRIHQRHAEGRRRAVAILHHAFADTPADCRDETQVHAEKLYTKLCNCGRHAAVFQDSDTGELVTSSAVCKSRVCPTCAARRAARVRDSVAAASKGINSPRFITLTPQHSDAPLKAQLAELRASYTRLRRSKSWKKNVTGAIAVVEVKWSTSSSQWHPHLHIIADGRYWSQRDLSNCWNVATGGATIVDIRMIHDRRNVARYVAKYVTDTGKNANIPAARFVEYAIALHGFRLVSTCGSLHGQVRETEKNDRPAELEQVAHLGALSNDAADGNQRAGRLWRCLQLVQKLQRAAGPDGLSGRDLDRRRKTARRLRGGWANTEGLDHRGRPIKHPGWPRARGPDRGTERLWQEPDVGPPVATVGPKR